ncbi:MAG: ABC transporter substrate-binding protein [Acidobacteria bacterium]|nr:MAG: ABC transporter substrate-binding protein [Acidobacteriota bacterium]
MLRVTDDLGRIIALAGPAQRIVSLVPSITETLCALGAGNRVSGVTDYCIHPAEEVRGKTKVGGTKTLRIETILSLHPDLVIANAEENRKHQVAKLEEAGLNVFVNFTRTVEGCLKMISDIASLTETEDAARGITASIRASLDKAKARAPAPPPRVLCPIWKNPYMSINRDTFVHSILRAAGGQNVFEEHPDRYPKFTLDEVVLKRPEVIILPTEPYRFTEADKTDFETLGEKVSAVSHIHIVEGELLSWYGPRVARALRELSALFRGETPSSGRG